MFLGLFLSGGTFAVKSEHCFIFRNWDSICFSGEICEIVCRFYGEVAGFIIVDGDGIYEHVNQHVLLAFKWDGLFPDAF